KGQPSRPIITSSIASHRQVRITVLLTAAYAIAKKFRRRRRLSEAAKPYYRFLISRSHAPAPTYRLRNVTEHCQVKFHHRPRRCRDLLLVSRTRVAAAFSLRTARRCKCWRQAAVRV